MGIALPGSAVFRAASLNLLRVYRGCSASCEEAVSVPLGESDRQHRSQICTAVAALDSTSVESVAKSNQHSAVLYNCNNSSLISDNILIRLSSTY